jgi:hypothetical protein
VLSVAGNVVWIGGPTGAGKTTVARRLVQRWGLRLYSADTRTWAHRDRAIAAGVEAAMWFESTPPAERAAASLEQRQTFLLRDERAPMVLDDVRALPATPLVVAEGDAIAPTLVDSARAVWLDPVVEFQLLHRSAAWVEIGRSADEARACGIPRVTVDEARPIQEVVDEVEALLAGPLRSGPHAASTDDRRALLRAANLDIVDQIRTGCARPWATAEPDTQVRSFVCECGDPSCDLDVDALVGAAAGTPVIAEGHGR